MTLHFVQTLSQVMAAVGLYGSNSMSGALDLGGASEQITFVPQNLPSHGRVDLRLYGQNYTVYTHSYLCFGRNEANRQLLASLVKVYYGQLVILHISYPIYNYRIQIIRN
jgi:apyrase